MLKELIRHPWRWPVIWALVMVTLTSVPGADLPHAPLLFAEEDKLVHFGLYAILGFLSASSARNAGGRLSAPVVLLGIATLAALDEFHQRFIPGRSMDVRDFVADVVGAIVGLWLFEMVRKRRERVT
ncbi:MAG: VanZ family protein [Gemmatimonadaceae bacterium]